MTADPYATAAGPGALATLNPLAKLAAVVPIMIALVFVRGPVTPAVLLVLAYAVLLAGARITRGLGALLVGLPVIVLLISIGFAAWTDAAQVAMTPVVWRIGEWRLHAGALEIGLATGLRLGALFALSLIPGASTSGPDLVRASVQQLRVPYRVGYTALAAFRFVPRFGHELDVIRQAHRVRGAHGGRGPFAAIARGWGHLVPLLAGAIRHAERVALAMDARAFGAHPDRTERHLVPWRARDTVFVAAFWALSGAVVWGAAIWA
ncbi:energy-coupling factor transporter transmembrane component T family protein [Microbacterium sp. CJ88]|uniref:energy-coupling factor transporter transmembrane component T family protein n=1 Tax=Microbacterium sp. CJ88 TaxID=3445672 RepID=UPI003F656D6D